jgi:hypothetical protein
MRRVGAVDVGHRHVKENICSLDPGSPPAEISASI